MIYMMKKYTFIILSSIATLFFSCDKAKVAEVWVKPPQLVQAYINPEIYGLGAEGTDGGLFVLLPCNVGQYGILRSNPKAYITNAANNRVYDSLRTVHNDRNDMAIPNTTPTTCVTTHFQVKRTAVTLRSIYFVQSERTIKFRAAAIRCMLVTRYYRRGIHTRVKVC